MFDVDRDQQLALLASRGEERWFVPSYWGTPSSGYPLATLRNGRGDGGQPGGMGVYGILPTLGMAAGLTMGSCFRASIESLARSAGISSKTASKAANALVRLGYAERWKHEVNGKPTTHWKLSPQLTSARRAGTSDSYFHFSMRLVYGGNWAALEPAQQALYLGAALYASRHETHPAQNWLLRELLSPHSSADDLTACHEAIGASRFACVSHRTLGLATGLTADAIQRTASALRRAPREDHPLRVYPTRDGHALLYHFRDHCPPTCLIQGGES